MTSWLHRQRKATLLELCNEAGLKQDEDTKKDDIVDALDVQLQKEKARLSSNSAFDHYYGTRRTPAKPRTSTTTASVSDAVAEVKSVVKQGGARPTKVKQEGPEAATTAASPVQAVVNAANDAVTKVTETLSKTADAASTAVVKTTKTPARRRTVLPPTPRDVADQVEAQSNKVYAQFDDALARSGVQESVDYVRDLCSSVSGVQLTFLGLEWYALSQDVLPWKYVADLPWLPLFGMPNHIAVKLPDLFVVLTGYFWTTTLLWALTSIMVPTVFGFFYNLTVRDVKRAGNRVAVARYMIDPLTFNVVKALATWQVYGRGVSFGFINPEVAIRVNHAMFGGWFGVLVGSGICVLASLYEAAQHRK